MPTLPETPLYDFAPVLRLMLMGLLIAAAPLTWAWLRSKSSSVSQRLRVLTLVILFFTFDLVLFGAFTRLTDSGLGCPDWPGCYGHASPVGAQMHITAAQNAMPSGPVTLPKAWIEMVHRYFASGVGVLILILALASWFARKQTQLSPKLAIVTLMWVCLQGAFGALTVTMKLFPAIVTLHLLGGMVLLALLKTQAMQLAQVQGQHVVLAVSGKTRILVVLTFVLLWLQIALGGWVSTNYAVMACTDFPACQNSLWPAMNFKEGFTFWRALGAGLNGDNISFQALTAIHYVHRLSAYVLFAAAIGLAFQLYKFRSTRRQACWLAGLVLFQMATGLGNVWLGWPLAAAVLHTAGAAGLVVVMTGIICTTRYASATAPASKFSSSQLFV